MTALRSQETQPGGKTSDSNFPDVVKHAPELQLDLEADTSAFEALERDFQEVGWQLFVLI